MNCSKLLTALCCLSIVASTVHAQEEEEYFEEETKLIELSTLWDFRYIHTDTTTGWLDAGLGKTRYGGRDGESRDLFRVPQASFVLDLHPASSFTTHVQVNLDLEPEHPEGRYGWDRIRLIEAFARWAPSLNEAGTAELRVKGGFFFPHVSLEHFGTAWSTFYSITPSATNAWIGEEVRATGVETAFAHVGLSNEWSLGGAVFWNNDPTGSLLAWRGFAAHDRQTGLRDRVPLPPIPSIGPKEAVEPPGPPVEYPEYPWDPQYPEGPGEPEQGPDGSFPDQAPWVEPFVEIDGRAGYYVNGSWQNYQWFEVNGIFYDNRGNPEELNDGQYAWRTRFGNIGAVVFLPLDMEVVGQFMTGDTLMGFPEPQSRVTADFRSWFVLWSVPVGRHQFSVRYEDIRVWDRDEFNAPDGSDESGDIWTVAYWLSLFGEHRLGAELMRVDSKRAARITLGDPVRAEELIFQLNLRVEF